MEAEVVRVSDLAASYVGYEMLSKVKKEFVYNKDDLANIRHEELKLELCDDLYVDYLMRKYRYISRVTGGNIVVKGSVDGFMVKENKLMIIEFKTVRDGIIKEKMIEYAKFQLKLYIWLMKRYIDEERLELNDKHCVVYIDRDTGKRVRMDIVEEDKEIELAIWRLVAERDRV